MENQDREKIVYDSDLGGVVRIPSGESVSPGNLAKFGSDGTIVDSGKAASSIVTSSDMEEAVASAVSSASEKIWESIKSVEAWRAYRSSAWQSGTSYSEGDLCMYSGAGYKCKEHTSSSTFLQSEWEVVLTSEGKTAIDGILSGCLNEGMASLSDIAPDFGNEEYVVDGLVVKDGKLKICTSGGFSTGASFKDGTVEESISNRIEALRTSLLEDIQKGVDAYARDYVEVSGNSVYAHHGSDSVELAKESSLSEKADSEAIDDAYEPSDGYSQGDTCTHGGKWYKCISDVAAGSEFDDSHWDEITVKDAIEGGATQVNADWNETNANNPAYIKNKPSILYPYKIEEISALNPGASGYLSNSVSYKVKDRTVNVIRPKVGESENIRILVPDPLDDPYARDFVVVIYATQMIEGEDEDESSPGSSDPPEEEISSGDYVDVYVNAGLESYDGRFVVSNLSAIIGKSVAYRFIEIGLGYRNTFLVTGFSDPAYQKVLEIDRALDAILIDGGVSVDLGYYIPGDDGKLHRIEAVTDEFGDMNISVEKEGVDR